MAVQKLREYWIENVLGGKIIFRAVFTHGLPGPKRMKPHPPIVFYAVGLSGLLPTVRSNRTMTTIPIGIVMSGCTSQPAGR